MTAAGVAWYDYAMAIEAPVKPPAGWFKNPGLTAATPMVVEDSGRVYGHLATWNQKHVGIQGRDVTPPRSTSNYGYFLTGLLSSAEGEQIPVGQFTLSGGHAPLEASASDAAAHYDNTDSVFADVTVGEDAHGIWFAGAIRPGLGDLKERVIRSSALSGDWRPIGQSLELIAACSVNSPGFPIPRVALAASGRPLALVAAGTSDLWLTQLGLDSVVASLEAQIDRIDTKARLRQRIHSSSARRAIH